MRFLGAIPVFLLLLCSCNSSIKPTKVIEPLQCNPQLWEHTYSKERFIINSLCIHVTVIASEVWFSEDGDLVADAKVQSDNSFIHLEIPCAHSPNLSTTEGREAASSCNGFTSSSELFPINILLEVAGPDVIDLRHHWREIHGAVWRVKSAT